MVQWSSTHTCKTTCHAHKYKTPPKHFQAEQQLRCDFCVYEFHSKQQSSSPPIYSSLALWKALCVDRLRMSDISGLLTPIAIPVQRNPVMNFIEVNLVTWHLSLPFNGSPCSSVLSETGSCKKQWNMTKRLIMLSFY